MVREQQPSREASKESALEKGSRLYRNWNVVGAVALGGLAMIAPVGGNLLAIGAGINAVQAGAGEAMRRQAKKSRQRS